MAKDAAACFGSRRDPMTLPFRCTSCNARDVEISFGWMDRSGRDLKIVWKTAPPDQTH